MTPSMTTQKTPATVDLNLRKNFFQAGRPTGTMGRRVATTGGQVRGGSSSFEVKIDFCRAVVEIKIVIFSSLYFLVFACFTWEKIISRGEKIFHVAGKICPLDFYSVVKAFFWFSSGKIFLPVGKIFCPWKTEKYRLYFPLYFRFQLGKKFFPRRPAKKIFFAWGKIFCPWKKIFARGEIFYPRGEKILPVGE